ncbi:hypothetical protein Fmac_016976 [Flemingia macrophylla]|uniref:Protein PLASTID MOVEMENT IMPAIRED 2 n=1 Tax=Flemingia macrophylla TaxID=520843 RepID=A0ABD1MJS0_9FABA
MDGSASKPGNTTRVGLVKAAVNLYGNRIADVNCPLLNKDFPTKQFSKVKELHRASRDIVRYKESKQAAEYAKSQAENELSTAKKTVKDLFSMIGESSHTAKAQMRDIASLKKHGKGSNNDNNNNEYSQVMSELECAKHELFQLKLDMASVLEEKLRAEKEIEASRSNTLSLSRIAQKLRKEIEETNEEQVVVELARMEALKELRDIEALENTRNKLKEAIKEIDEVKELEKKLATTLSDIDILKKELKLVKKNRKRVERGESMKYVETEVISIKTTKEELEAAKKDLALIREKGFKFMTSMDVTRNELKHVKAATVYIKNAESKTGAKVRNMSYKLLRAKSKLEAVSSAEEKAKSIVVNLSQTLDKLKSETEAAKRQKNLINEEVAATKEDIKKSLLDMNVGEERLQGAMQKVEEAKTSESLALEKLKILTENIMRERSLSLTTKASSLITISKFEYEYLTNHAAEANEIADKKVEAAKAWVEAVRASEKEIVMKTKVGEAKLEVYAKEKLVPKRVGNEEFENRSRKVREKNNDNNNIPAKELQRGTSRKSMKSDGSMTPSRGFKVQKSASPRVIVKKKKKVIPNLAKFFRGKRNTSSTL